MDAIDKVILELIAQHDGRWSWYQLDRALSAQGLLNIELMKRLARLQEEDWIRAEGSSPQPRYWITAKARATAPT